MDIKVEHSLRMKVPFFDVDPMQIVWHGHYFKYFDLTRQSFAERCGLDFYRYREDAGFVFPLVKSQIKHVHPLRFNDQFDCSLALVEVRVKVVMDFRITLVSSGILCARGRTEQVALKLPEMTLELAIPQDIQDALLRAGTSD